MLSRIKMAHESKHRVQISHHYFHSIKDRDDLLFIFPSGTKIIFELTIAISMRS